MSYISSGLVVGLGFSGLAFGLIYARDTISHVLCKTGMTAIDTYVDLKWALQVNVLPDIEMMPLHEGTGTEIEIVSVQANGYKEYVYKGKHYIGKQPSIPRSGETVMDEYVESMVISTTSCLLSNDIRERIRAAFYIMAGPKYDFCGETPTLEYLYATDGGLRYIGLTKVIYNTDLCNEYVLS